MKKSYENFSSMINLINFESICQKIKKLGLMLPKPQTYQLETPTIKYRKIVSFNGNQQFDNRENTYLRMIDLFKGYCASSEDSLLVFLSREDNFSHLLNKIQNLRIKNTQFQLLMFMMAYGSKKLIKTYLKVRKQILTRCNLDRRKFSKISLHNQSKYFKNQTQQLQHIQIDYQYWGFMAQTAKSEISEEMLWWLSSGKRQLNAIELMKVFLWEHTSDNPQE